MVTIGSKEDKKSKIKRSKSIIYWTFIIFVIILLVFLAYAEDVSFSFLYIDFLAALFVSFGIYSGRSIPIFRRIWKIMALMFVFLLIFIYVTLHYHTPEHTISFDIKEYNRKVYHFYDLILNIFIIYLCIVTIFFIINIITGWFHWLKRSNG